MERIFLLAIATMSLGMSLIPLGDTFGKALVTHGVSPGFVGWSRFALGALIMAAFTNSSTLARLLRNWRVWLRGSLMTGGVVCILTALRTEPVANVFGAFFVGPVIAYILSVWLLRETATRLRTTLLLIGFSGVLLVVKPGFGLTSGLIWAVLAGTFYGGFLTASRWLSDLCKPHELLAASLLVAAVLTAPLGLANLPGLSVPRLGLIAGSALSSMCGNLLLIMAFRRAPASVLAPFVYVQLISATLLGWFVFGGWPDPLAFAGLALIVVSGLATLWLRR